MLLRRERCCFPNCTKFPDHSHHITYDPEVTKPLCRPHHEEITILNGQHARKVRHELSNKHRWWIWFQWIEGKLKIRRTRKALHYIEEWDQRPAVQTESSVVITETKAFAELSTPKKRTNRRKKPPIAKSSRPMATRTKRKKANKRKQKDV